jgi:hypothetical protein
MGLTTIGRRQRGCFFPSLSLLALIFLAHGRSFGTREAKDRWQDKEMQCPTCVYIAKTGRRTGESKEATESCAFNAETMETAMITFSFFSLAAHTHASH